MHPNKLKTEDDSCDSQRIPTIEVRTEKQKLRHRHRSPFAALFSICVISLVSYHNIKIAYILDVHTVTLTFNRIRVKISQKYLSGSKNEV